MTGHSKSCVITGSGGYLGSELSLFLKNSGWRVTGTARHPKDRNTIQYSLEDGLESSALQGIDALVHCAYDFGHSSWDEIHLRNVAGTKQLLKQARNAGVKTIITISSISAFKGCRSFYGKAKLEIEETTLAARGIVLRPGLIYGGSNQGMYGRLVKQVKSGRPIPLLIGSPCTQFLVHVEDLCGIIEALLSAKVPKFTDCWTIANPRPWPLKKLLKTIAKAEDVEIHFIPVPWQLVWLALRSLEIIGLKLPFKSDSVKSIIYQNLNPDLSHAQNAGLEIRDLGPAD
jgi:nucleoside-diphosphate-sugar epimerase